MRILWRLIVITVVLAVVTPVAATAAPGRIALVIGNSRYTHLPKLPNGARDATAVARALALGGYDVEAPLADASEATIRTALERFRAKVRALPPKAMAVIYFAGHGFMANGRSYIVGTEAPAKTPSGAVPGYVSLSDLIDSASVNDKAVGIVIVDACRSLTDLKALGIAAEGYAAPAVPPNVFVELSTSPNRPASDGVPDRNSPFATALLLQMATPGVGLTAFFGGVNERMWEATNRSQLGVYYTPFLREELFIGTAVDNAATTYAMAKAAYAAKDYVVAFQRDLAAAEMGNIQAMYALGDDYFRGVGTSIDRGKARSWFQKTIAAGEPKGYVGLAYLELYKPAADGKYDPRLVVQLLEKGIAAGDKLSAFTLACLLGSEWFGIKDGPRAIQLYQSSLDTENCCGAINIGKLYAEGKLVPRDLAKAAYYYQYAADKGNAMGWNGLGHLATGRGDLTKALYYYTIGFSFAEPFSTYGLAAAYYNGNGVAQDRERGYQLMLKAMEFAKQTQNQEAIDRATEGLNIVKSGAWWAERQRRGQ